MALKILFEDSEILVCIKPPTVPSQGDPTGDLDMLSWIKQERSIDYVGLIHRLDRPVGGVMVFGKTPFATANVSKQLQNKSFKKAYLAVVCGKAKTEEKELVHYLHKNAAKNLSKVVDASRNQAKKAILSYHLLKYNPERNHSLIEVQLHTGRHHQIRVQLAYEGLAIWGDTKYNDAFKDKGGWKQIALWSKAISFEHPKTGKNMSFEVFPIGQEGFDAFEPLSSC